MSEVNTRVFREISAIIEGDDTNTTYKFALLRATIDIIQQYGHFSQQKKDEIIFPIGLLVERWLLYYYPFFREQIPQQAGEIPRKNHLGLAFRDSFKPIVAYYQGNTIIDGFYRDIAHREFPEPIRNEMIVLIRSIARTIKKMPMRYLGNSIFKKEYSVYRTMPAVGKFTITPKDDDLFGSGALGYFAISMDVFEVFRFMGSFISGKANLLFKWAEFTANLENCDRDVNTILNELLYEPDKSRDVNLATHIFENSGIPLICTWTSKQIHQLNIDHVIPYSLWYNNDLWNLLPAEAAINGKKSDAIPHPQAIINSAENITRYWEVLRSKQEPLFLRQMRKSLTGNLYGSGWPRDAISKLAKVCDELISVRGLKSWQP